MKLKNKKQKITQDKFTLIDLQNKKMPFIY